MNSKIPTYVLIVIICSASVFSAQEQKSAFPILKGPYLGQKPPGKSPEIFAQGIISTQDLHEGGAAFTLDARIFIFKRNYPVNSSTIYLTELKKDRWTKPSPAPFDSEYEDWDFHFAPDSKTLYFTSKRPLNEGGEALKYGHIWVTKMTQSGWEEPRSLGYRINTPDSHSIYPSLTQEGTLYFFTNREGGFGQHDIYCSELVNGKYTKVENLGEVINTENWEYDLYIAPDETYLIFSSNRPGGFGKNNDMFIVFRKTDGTWTSPVNLGKDFCDAGGPSVTLDGKYFFFASDRTGICNIYWVDAGFIDELKPNSLE